MSGQVLAGFDVNQRRSLYNSRTSQQKCQQDHRPPQHEITADGLFFDDFGRQRLVVIELIGRLRG
jgi:hypothetical protein